MATDQCVSLLAQLIEHNTVNSRTGGKPHAERALAEYLVAYADRCGLEARRLRVTDDDFNVLICAEGQTTAPWLLFDSHLDTVGVSGMTIDPFGAQIRDGRMYGRGACDTKGSGAAMLAALQAYAAKSDRYNNIALLFSIDEESGKSGVKAFVDQQIKKLNWRPSGVIVGEPTMSRLVVAHNGVARWKVTTQGKAVHSSDPSRGRSAITAMLRVAGAIETQYAPKQTASHSLTGCAQCSVNTIRGGTQINVIPDHCQIEVDRRIVPGECIDEVDRTFRAQVELLDATVEPLMLDPALSPEGFELFHDFLMRVMSACDVEPTPMGVGYGTNASTFAQAGLPSVVLGPGDIAQAHTADEWVELQQVQRATMIYHAMMTTPWSDEHDI